MQNRDKLMEVARIAEKASRDLKAYIEENVSQAELFERDTITYAGVILSMASSVICELYQGTKPKFDLTRANTILREWGADELV